jgi:hypothetical protein
VKRPRIHELGDLDIVDGDRCFLCIGNDQILLLCATAELCYLLLHNEKIRHFIDTIGRKLF